MIYLQCKGIQFTKGLCQAVERPFDSKMMRTKKSAKQIKGI